MCMDIQLAKHTLFLMMPPILITSHCTSSANIFNACAVGILQLGKSTHAIGVAGFSTTLATYLLSRHASCQELQQISGFDNDKRIKGLASSFHRHGPLNLRIACSFNGRQFAASADAEKVAKAYQIQLTSYAHFLQ